MNHRAEVFFSFHLLFWFLFFSIQSIAFHYLHAHAYKHTPTGSVLITVWPEGEILKIDDLIARSCGCHLFSFAHREKATGQIPALQTTLWEEEEEGGEGGLWWSRAEGEFFYWGSVQWSCVWRWGVQSKSEVTTLMKFHFYSYLSELYIMKLTFYSCRFFIADTTGLISNVGSVQGGCNADSEGRCEETTRLLNRFFPQKWKCSNRLS